MCHILTVSVILSKTLLSLFLMSAIQLNQTFGLHIVCSVLPHSKGPHLYLNTKENPEYDKNMFRDMFHQGKWFGCYLENYISNYSTRRILHKI